MPWYDPDGKVMVINEPKLARAGQLFSPSLRLAFGPALRLSWSRDPLLAALLERPLGERLRSMIGGLSRPPSVRRPKSTQP
jgi:hypothetical protein